MVTKKGKTWSARATWYDGSGKRHFLQQSGFRTKKAAELWVEDTVAAHTGLMQGTMPETTTLKRLHEEYIEQLKVEEASPRTIEFYKDAGKHYLPILGGERVRNITPLAVQTTVDKMRLHADGTPYRSATVWSHYRALRAVINYGVKLGLLPSSPCINITLPPEQEHEAVIYSPDDLFGLLNAMREQGHELYWPISLYVQNALRRGEALGVRWQDIDFSTGIVHIRANVTLGDGMMYMKRAKTRSSETEIVLTDEFLEDLKELRERRLAQGLYRLGKGPVEGITLWENLDPAEFICLTKDGKVFRPGGMARRLQAFQRRNGFPESTIHDLRHTYGTIMTEAEVNLTTISKAMRHSSVAITANMYVSGTTKIRRQATEAMGNILQLSKKAPEADQKG